MNKVKTGALYLFLGAGGLWHLLGVFQGVMRVFASPIMFGLAIWLFSECWRIYPQQERPKFTILSIGVIGGSFAIEWLGVQTGEIFGSYLYGQTLRPSVGGVPISIGCAWFVLLIASTAVAQKIAPKSLAGNLFKLPKPPPPGRCGLKPHLPRCPKSLAGNLLKLPKPPPPGRCGLKPHLPRCPKSLAGNLLKLPFLVAALMVCFDLLMEPAAVKLDYWSWLDNCIPLRNYLVWFGLGFIFTTIGLQTGVFRRPLPRIAIHFYFAQLIYFGLVVLKS